MKSYTARQQGFTLVELAIVMIIIGLLIGGVLKGQQLIENAKVTGIINQVTSYRAAHHSFRDTYSATAGDMANATGRLAGCDGVNNCGNGDGNSLVGTPISGSGGGEALNQANQTSLPGVETTYFWKHLALADLITGVQINAAPNTDTAWGVTHPASKMRGGFHIFYSAQGSDWGTGHVLRLQSPANAGASGGAGTMPISPIQARMIDIKMDDGRPDSGSVAADYEGSNCDPGGTYAATTQKNCIMYFELD